MPWSAFAQRQARTRLGCNLKLLINDNISVMRMGSKPNLLTTLNSYGYYLIYKVYNTLFFFVTIDVPRRQVAANPAL